MHVNTAACESVTDTLLLHDWLLAERGGEQVLRAMVRLLPRAHIRTLVHRAGSVGDDLAQRVVGTSWLQRADRWLGGRFRALLPLFPAALNSLDTGGYRLIISSSHCAVKGVRVLPWQTHVAYIHSPMRYLYDQMETYLPRVARNRAGRLSARAVTYPLRRWDRLSSARPHVLVANSHFVAQRIRTLWQRQAQVVHPPVDTQDLPLGGDGSARAGFVFVGALVPYKRADLAVAAANRGLWPLTVVGDGPLAAKLRAQAGPNVRFVARMERPRLGQLLARSRGFLLCGTEDFGMAPVEALAAGCPVVALRGGGALDYVMEHQDRHSQVATGVMFARPQVAALLAAVKCADQRWDSTTDAAWQPQAMRAFASTFGPQAFARGMQAAVDRAHEIKRQRQQQCLRAR